jgi:hypothetical protein
MPPLTRYRFAIAPVLRASECRAALATGLFERRSVRRSVSAESPAIPRVYGASA